MPYIDPNSNVIILRGVPLDAEREHTVWFDTPLEQGEWFEKYMPPSRDGFTFYLTSQSYVKEHKESIRVGIPYRYLYDCNYLIFTNKSHENRPFYCFIDYCEYVNESVTIIHYSMDVMQTYMFDFVVKPCLVEREHTATDVAGENIVPEGLDVGEYVCDRSLKWNGSFINRAGFVATNIGRNLCYIMISSKDILGKLSHPATGGWDDLSTPKDVCRVFNGVGVFVITNGEYLGSLLYEMGLGGVQDSIAAVFPFPASLINWNAVHYNGSTYPLAQNVGRIYDSDDGTVISSVVRYLNSTVSHTTGDGVVHTYHTPIHIPKLTSGGFIDGYLPFNNKLYTAPFCWGELSDNLGHTNLYRQEMFSGDEIEFGFIASISAQPEVLAFPRNYKNVENNYEEGLTMSNGYNYCPWQYDTYRTWLMQNKSSLALSFTEGAVQAYLNYGAMAVGKITQSASISDTAMTITKKVRPMKRTIHAESTSSSSAKNLNPYEQAGSGASGIMKCANVLATMGDRSAVPDSTRGQLNNSNINTALRNNDFFYYIKTLRADYAQKIDEYFTRFGYAVNQIKTPNFFDPTGHKRPRWNYIKTADAKVECAEGKNFNHEVEQALENLLNRGITFWNKNVDMYDYTQTSSVNNKPTV